MSNFIDLIGQNFGRLIVIQRMDNNKWGQSMWFCKCDCKNRIIVRSNSLKSGNTQSCGCLQKERSSASCEKLKFIHGYARTGKQNRTYKSWTGMIQRCTNPNYNEYKYYGGRDITVCKRWLKFENFLKDMGKAPPGLTIERKDNYKGYYKKNCKWATRKQQARNRRSNIYITHNRKTQLLIEWSEETGIPYSVLWDRIYKHKWTIEKSLETSYKKRNQNNEQSIRSSSLS